jgi:hypothetical protein
VEELGGGWRVRGANDEGSSLGCGLPPPVATSWPAGCPAVVCPGSEYRPGLRDQWRQPGAGPGQDRSCGGVSGGTAVVDATTAGGCRGRGGRGFGSGWTSIRFGRCRSVRLWRGPGVQDHLHSLKVAGGRHAGWVIVGDVRRLIRLGVVDRLDTHACSVGERVAYSCGLIDSPTRGAWLPITSIRWVRAPGDAQASGRRAGVAGPDRRRFRCLRHRRSNRRLQGLTGS